MSISISNCTIKVSKITYWRKPTKEEINFGYGATHFRDFEFEKCFDDNGILKLKVKASDDNLIYYYSGSEYLITSKAIISKIVV
jgi:hypothetical protein